MITKTFLVFFVWAGLSAWAQPNPEWRVPHEPYKIAGNIYYVGGNDVASYLITTPDGHIVLDSGVEQTAPQIIANIKKLGFHPEDVKILLNMHAHADHAGGFAELKRVTHARLLVSKGDTPLMENGGHNDFAFGNRFLYPAVKPDGVIVDGQHVALGGTTLVAHLTPGHTKGCTSWTDTVAERGQKYNIVFVCSSSAPGYQLVNNKNYPNIIQDFERSFMTLRALPCDIPLGSHAGFFNLNEKAKLAKTTTGRNVFVDPQGYRDYLDQSESAFRKMIKEQSK